MAAISTVMSGRRSGHRVAAAAPAAINEPPATEATAGTQRAEEARSDTAIMVAVLTAATLVSQVTQPMASRPRLQPVNPIATKVWPTARICNSDTSSRTTLTTTASAQTQPAAATVAATADGTSKETATKATKA